MKFSASLTELNLGLCLLLNGVLVEGTGCNADNCLRAMFPTQSPAAISSALAFCATYTTKINTATTGFPTRATGGCGTSTARYSSACSCKPTTTSSTTLATSTTSATSTSTSTATSTISATSTTNLDGCTATPSNNLVQNGNFECLHYLDYWTAQDVTNTYHMSADGDNSYNSYQFKIVGYPASETTVASLSQDVPGLTIGASYMLSYALWFNKCDQSFGFVGVNLNHKALSTFDSCDDGQAAVGKWLTLTYGPFTAVANSENLKFEFVIGLQDLGGYIRLDNVAITPA